MRFPFLLGILLVPLVGTYSAQVLAGERLVFNVVQAQAKERVTLYMQGDQARLSSSANSRAAVIFDAEARQIHIIDHAQKSVTTMDQASIEQLASMAKGMGEFAQSQGAVLGDLFKSFGLGDTAEQATLEVKTLSESQEVAGFECQLKNIYSDGTLDTQICMSQQLKLSAQEQQTFDRLMAFAQLLIREGQMVLQQFSLPIPLLPEEALEGVPVYVKNIPGNTTATLTERKKMDIQAAQFSLPAGYKKTLLSL